MIKMCTPEEFLEGLNTEKDVILIDVRTKEEYDTIHIPNSTLIDYHLPNFIEEISKLDRDKNYYIYCKLGIRSVEVINEMAKLGFINLKNLNNGITNWHGPVE